MPSLIDMRRRIRAVKSTQQITKAMKMVAASKLRRAQERVLATRPYAAQARHVLARVMTMPARAAGWRSEHTDLLVVADRFDVHAGRLGQPTDRQWAGCRFFCHFATSIQGLHP